MTTAIQIYANSSPDVMGCGRDIELAASEPGVVHVRPTVIDIDYFGLDGRRGA
jgi:hypothetical protein